MTRFCKSSFAAITVLLAAGAVALPASARGVVAYAGGRSYLPADASCFLEFWGAARNNCAATKAYEISLPIDSDGFKNVWVFAKGASASNNVGCRAIGVDTDLTAWGTNFKYLPSFGTTQTITLTDVYVPPWGSLYAFCWVDPGGQVNSVGFDY